MPGRARRDTPPSRRLFRWRRLRRSHTRARYRASRERLPRSRGRKSCAGGPAPARAALLASRLAAALAGAALGGRLIPFLARRRLARTTWLGLVGCAALTSAARFRLRVGECVLAGHWKIRNRFLYDWLRRRAMGLDDANRKQVGGNDSDARAHRSASAPPRWWGAARTHARRDGRYGLGYGLRRLAGRELFADRSRRGSGRDLVVVAAAAKIDNVGVVSVLKDADEIPLAQALAVATQQLARCFARLTGANRGGTVGADRASYQVERFLAPETESAGSDLVAFCWRFGAWRFVTRGSGCLSRHRRSSCRSRLRAMSPSLAVASPAASSATTGTLYRLSFFSRWLPQRVSLDSLLTRRQTGRRDARSIDLELTILEFRQGQQTAMCRFRYEPRELGHADVLLVERGVDRLHYLLEAIGAHHVAVPLHAIDRFGDELPRIFLDDFFLARLHEAGEGVVAVVLVAVLDKQVARRFADADADDVLPVFLELDDEAREIRIAGQQDEGADFRSGENQLQSVDGEANVGGIFLRGPVCWREDQIDRRFRERHDVLRISPPVGVRALHGHFAFDDVGGEEVFQLRLEIGANAHRDVVEVDEQGGVWRVVGAC